MTATDSAPDLAYVALVVDEPETSANIFEKDFGLPRQDFSVAADRPSRPSLLGDPPWPYSAGRPVPRSRGAKGVHHIAIGADDPEAAARDSGLPTINGATDGIDRRPQIEIARDATAGVRTRLTPVLGMAPSSSEIVQRIDHLGVASADNHAARTAFIDRLGCVYESQQTDSEVETVSENFTSDTYKTRFSHAAVSAYRKHAGDLHHSGRYGVRVHPGPDVGCQSRRSSPRCGGHYLRGPQRHRPLHRVARRWVASHRVQDSGCGGKLGQDQGGRPSHYRYGRPAGVAPRTHWLHAPDHDRRCAHAFRRAGRRL